MIFSAANALGNNQRKSDGHYNDQKPHAGQEKREETKEPENNKKLSISSSQILNDKKVFFLHPPLIPLNNFVVLHLQRRQDHRKRYLRRSIPGTYFYFDFEPL